MRVSRLTRLVWLGICLALLCGRSARGGTIYWNMNDLATPTSNNLANLVVSALAQGNSSTTGTSGQSVSSGYSFTLSGSSGTASGGNNLNFSAKSDMLDTGSSSYLSLTLTPNTGYSGTVTAIGFGSRSTATGPTTLSLRSSADAYAANVTGFSPSTNSAWTYFTSTFPSPLAIASGSALTLRLYGSGGSSASSGNWRLDDLQLDVVIVPEPAALGLGLVGLAAAVAQAARRGRRTGKGGEGTEPCGDHTPASRSSSCSS